MLESVLQSNSETQDVQRKLVRDPFQLSLDTFHRKKIIDRKQCQMSLYKKNLPVKGLCGRCLSV
jgi:hypothetical protein